MTTVSSSTSTTTTTTTSTSATKAATGSSVLSSSKSGSGIDYSVLIDAAVQERLQPATTLDAKIATNNAISTAYTTLQGLIQTVDTGISGLRNRSTYSSSTTNIFGERSAYLSGGGSTGASNIMDATVADGTATGNYSLVVEQLATKNKIGSTVVSSSSSALGYSGSFTIGSGTGSTASISVTSTDTLTSLATKINNQASTTGVSASVMQVSDSTYELVLTSTSSGSANAITITDGGSGVTASLGLTKSDGKTIANNLVAAQDAKFSVDGVEMSRASNSFSDAITGVTMNLYQASTNTVSMEIGANLSAIKSAITDFVTNYNALHSELTTLTARNTDGTSASGATLADDSTARSIKSDLSNILTNSVTNSSGGVLSMSSLGITVATDGTLSYDETTLNSELSNNLDDVKTLLGLSMNSSDSGLMLMSYSSQTATMSGTLSIDMNEDGTVGSVSVNGDSSQFTVSGNTITGNAGTAYAGLKLVYTGAGGDVTFSAQSGLFDQFYTKMDTYANSSSGSLQTQINEITTNNSDLTERSQNIKSQADEYRTQLTSYYATLQAQAETAKSLLKQIKASMGAKTTSS